MLTAVEFNKEKKHSEKTWREEEISSKRVACMCYAAPCLQTATRTNDEVTLATSAARADVLMHELMTLMHQNVIKPYGAVA